MSADVVVVGGGAIGVCAAFELARRGASVTLLERGAELASGCSAGNAGLICPSHAAPLATPGALRQGLRWLGKADSPFALRPRPGILPWLARFVAACTPARARASAAVIRELASASQALHAELSASGLETGFARRGSLNVYETAASFAVARQEAADAERDGLRQQILDGSTAREIEPALALTPAGAVYYPDDAHCDPRAFVQALGDAAVEAGARVRTGVEAIGLRRRGARVVGVSTTAGDLTAEVIVLAAGAWTPGLARDAGAFVPVEGGKGYHVDYETGPGDPAIPVWLQDSRVIATPLPGRVRLSGTLELAGLDLSVDRRRLDAVVRAGKRAVAGLEGRRTIDVWRGLRPCSPDGLPIVGKVPGASGLVLATGHGMMGLALAPVTGQLVAQLVTGERPSHDLAPLRPERFRTLLG